MPIRTVYVDEQACIGCTLCAGAAPATFFMEESFGRARVYQQQGDAAPVIQNAIDLCPVRDEESHMFNCPLLHVSCCFKFHSMVFAACFNLMWLHYKPMHATGVVHSLCAFSEAWSFRGAATDAEDQPAQPPRGHAGRSTSGRHPSLDRATLGGGRRQGESLFYLVLLLQHSQCRSP